MLYKCKSYGIPYYMTAPHVPNLHCCTVHLVDSLIITQPTNALIVCHLF